jgi:guanosine-3',5'-bis(diphosphate) 3'-pyrophosphohydrolase
MLMARGDLQRAVLDLVVAILGGRPVHEPHKDAMPWLMRPGKIECRERWPLVVAIYRALESRSLLDVTPPKERRHIDAVVELPHGARRIIEIDEYQHFNGFRAATLRLYPKSNPALFPLKEWLKQCDAVQRLPGGDFASPRPPLFPGAGGRHKQRAFRDALCDLLPPLHGFEPTLRIAHFEVGDWIFGPRARERMTSLLKTRGLLPRTAVRRAAATSSLKSKGKRSRPKSAKRPRRVTQPQTAGTPYVRLLKAAAFAAGRHKNQRRKDAEASPYINHPLALAELLASAGVENEEVLLASLLHDTVEDTDTTFHEIEQQFGPSVAAIVREVTDDKTLPKENRKRLQVEHAAELSREAKLVKLADKICNLRDISSSPPADWALERKQEYFEWAKRVVDQMRGTHPELEQLFDAEYARRPEA